MLLKNQKDQTRNGFIEYKPKIKILFYFLLNNINMYLPLLTPFLPLNDANRKKKKINKNGFTKCVCVCPPWIVDPRVDNVKI